MDPDELPTRRLSFSSAVETRPLDAEGSPASERSSAALDTNVSVALRIRPLTQAEQLQGPATLQVVDPTTVRCVAAQASKSRRAATNAALEFNFDSVLGPDAAQADVFQAIMAPAISHSITARQDVLFFAYGMTNAGKTYTVSGTEDNPGVLPRTICEVFRLASAQPGMSVQASYLELYNDKLLDLLAACATGPDEVKRRTLLRLRQSRSGATEVVGLQRVTISSEQRALQLMHEGQAAKQTAETALNATSSRSHTVFTLRLHAEADAGSTPFFVHVVDLAGSERAGRTGAKGTRLREAARINNSLMVLHRCLSAMKTGAGAGMRLPVRDSKLTELFASAFTGARATLVRMLVAAAPSAADYDETLHAVKYGDIAQSAKPIAVAPKAATGTLRYDMNGRRIRGASADCSIAVPQARRSHALSDAASVVQSSEQTQIGTAQELAAHEVTASDLLRQIDELQMENSELRQALEEYEGKMEDVEERVRCEVAMEMADKMAELEAQYQASADAASSHAQARVAAAADLATRATTGRLLTRHVRRVPTSGGSCHSRSSTIDTPLAYETGRLSQASAGSSGSAGSDSADSMLDAESISAFQELQQTIRENEQEIQRLHSMYGAKLAAATSCTDAVREGSDTPARLRAQVQAAEQRATQAEGALLEARVQFEAQLHAMQEAMNSIQSTSMHVETHLASLAEAGTPPSAQRKVVRDRLSMSHTSDFKPLSPSPAGSPLVPRKRSRANSPALLELTNAQLRAPVPPSAISKQSAPVPAVATSGAKTAVSPTPIALRVRRRRRTGTAVVYAEC